MKTFIATLLIGVYLQPTFADQDTSETTVAQDVAARILEHCDFILEKVSEETDFVDEGNLQNPGTVFSYKTQQYCADALDGLQDDEDIRPYLTPEGLVWYEELQEFKQDVLAYKRTAPGQDSFFGRKKIRFEIAPENMPRFTEL